MIAHLGAQIGRVRLGIGHPGDKSQVMPYVLSDFPNSDAEWAERLLDACSRALPLLVAGDEERYQTEVMRLAPASKGDPRKTGG